METPDAQKLIAKLFAAFDYRRDKLTAAVYVEQVAKLNDPAVALRAIDSLIQGCHRLPTVAMILEEYRSQSDRAKPRFSELVEARPSVEEMEANKVRAKLVMQGKFAEALEVIQ